MTEDMKNIIGVGLWTAGTSAVTVVAEHFVVKPLVKVCKDKFGKKEEVKTESDDSTDK